MQDPIEAIATPDIYKQRANSQQLSIHTTTQILCTTFLIYLFLSFVQVIYLTCF